MKLKVICRCKEEEEERLSKLTMAFFNSLQENQKKIIRAMREVQ